MSELPAAVRAVEEAGATARRVAPRVAALSTGAKNDLLHDLADSLLLEAESILEANERDVAAAERKRHSEAEIDRLLLTRARLAAIAQSVNEVAALTDPVGEVLRGSRRPNGLVVQEIRVPLGVVGLISEGRPNLTIDAISLSLKAGNATLQLVDSTSIQTCRALMKVVSGAIDRQDIPAGAIQLIEATDDAVTASFIRMRECIDVLIPRGSSDLVRRICAEATVPTIEAGAGNCHLYVEGTARLDLAADIAFNAKVNRPGAANSIETLLIDESIAEAFLRIIGSRLSVAGVEIRACERSRELLPGSRAAVEADWSTEFLDLILAVKIVNNVDEAVSHIARYGTRHSEAIVTQDYSVARRFCDRVDAAAVYVNASTRFTDGFELGLGAEMGVSTQKLHRRGPIGLRALTTWKWVVQGEGQVRD